MIFMEKPAPTRGPDQYPQYRQSNQTNEKKIHCEFIKHIERDKGKELELIKTIYSLMTAIRC
jgi:hypothetical protein